MLAHGLWFSPGTPVSSTTKTGRHDITESGVKHYKSIKSLYSLLFPLLHVTELVNSHIRWLSAFLTTTGRNLTSSNMGTSHWRIINMIWHFVMLVLLTNCITFRKFFESKQTFYHMYIKMTGVFKGVKKKSNIKFNIPLITVECEMMPIYCFH